MATIPPQPVPVIIADDHMLVRTGLRLVLEASGRFSVVAEAQNGSELISMLRTTPCELVILDLNMPDGPTGELSLEAARLPPTRGPGLSQTQARLKFLRAYSGLLALEVIKHHWPAIKVLIVTQYDEADVIQHAVTRGVNGFLLKDEVNERILHALDFILRGESAYSERIQAVRRALADGRLEGGLSKRELEVLELVANGFRDREIAERLDITRRTVAFHKSNLKEKLNLENTAELIAYYYSRSQ